MRRFDKQLQFVFTILSGLTLLVGATSIGVNRYLIKSHDAVLNEAISVIQRSERIGADADLARGLAGQLMRAETEAGIIRANAELVARIGAISTGVTELRQFLGDARGAPDEAAAAHDLAGRMTWAAQQSRRLAGEVAAERARLEATGLRLAALIADETDLARLRVTAGIWEMYAAPPGRDIRPGLDRLADRDFFAFERIGELSRATAELARIVQHISDSQSPEDLARLGSQMRDALRLARARAAFLPSPLAAEAALGALGQYEGAGNRQALAGTKAAALTAGATLAGLSERLEAQLDALTEEARLGRESARTKMRAQIADAGRRAALLSTGLAVLTGVGVAAGGVVWLYARRRIVSRLGAVSERVVGVARGAIDAPMPISGHDEIGRLEKAVNVLRRRTAEALELRASLEAAVLARTADVVAEMRLANSARADAEEASRAKTHFLARMSHEIRTPLNGVIGMLDLLAAAEEDAGRRARLQTALTSARDLQALTDDILTFSSGEEGRQDAARAAFDPAQLARHLADHLRALTAETGLRAVVDVAPALPPALLGEALRIRQVVGNLISNAVKYTRQGEVRLDVLHEGPDREGLHVLSFFVTDTGPGMSAQETLRAFDIYGRTDSARRRGIKGVGLGLAIARQLTDAMGGELRVSSEPGRGSCFGLVLRLPPADPAGLPEPEGALPAAALRRVLVVDDHPVNRLVARGYLERMGCAVAEAATGQEALDLARGAAFDAMLIDLDLPDLHGADVAARIDRKGARLAIVTADLVADDAATRARFGADHVLTKPVSPRALAGVLSGPEAAAAPAPGPAGAETEATLRRDMADLGAELTAEIVANYLRDLATAVPGILAAGDAEDRRRRAHRLKGASANFALDGLCALLRRVEADEAEATAALAAEAERTAAALRGAARRAGLQLPATGAKQ